MKNIFLIVALTIFVTFISGCGTRQTDVSGKAVYEDDGTPLPHGFVCFIDVGSDYSVSGEIQADGTYSLRNRADGKKGIKPGEYKIVLGSTRTMEKSGNTFVTKDTVAAEFTETKTTPLTVTVKAGSSMTYDIKIPRPKSK
jgi:hypothetical protein